MTRTLSLLLAAAALTQTARGDDAFVRGDANADGLVNIADPSFLLNFLFLGGPDPTCADTLDANDDGNGNIADASFTLNFLFLGGPETPAPYPDCGVDPTPDNLDCASYPRCAPPAPASIVRESPTHGEEHVSLTRGVEIEFSREVEAMPEGAVTVRFGGVDLPADLRLSANRRIARLFCSEPLPSSARVRVTVDGGRIVDLAEGLAVDADGDGEPGGVRRIDFDTASVIGILNTSVFGDVFASEKGPRGEEVALEGVVLTVVGTDITATTGPDGRYELVGVPVPEFFVEIDGSGVKSTPPGGYYPILGKRFHSTAGYSRPQFRIYLPLIPNATLVDVQPDQPARVGLPAEGRERLAELVPGVDPAVFDRLVLEVPPGSLQGRDGTPGTKVGIFPVDSSRLPTPLPGGLTHRFDITVQADAELFDVPAPITFPNLDGLKPGEKTLLMSFDHAKGDWVVAGTMTATEDLDGDGLGDAVRTDPGVGVRAPGWHQVQFGCRVKIGPPAPCRGNECCGQPGGFRTNCPDNPCIKNADGCIVEYLDRVKQCFSDNGNQMPCISSGNDGCSHGKGGTRPSCHYTNQAVDIQMRDNNGIQHDKMRVQAIAKCLAGNQPLVYEAPNKWYKASNIEYKDCKITLLVELVGPDYAPLKKTGPHYHLEIEGCVGLKKKDRIPCECSTPNLLVIAAGGELGEDDERSRIVSPFDFLLEFGSDSYLRGTARHSSGDEFVLPPLNPGLVVLFSRATNTLWATEFITPLAGGVTTATNQTSQEKDVLAALYQDLVLPSQRNPVFADESEDRDVDGLRALTERILGTNDEDIDTDHDGSPDGAELRAGTDPLDGLPAAIGVLASIDTPGVAQDICAADNLVAVADGPAGVSLLDTTQLFSPRVIARVDTPGTARAVACAGDFIVVADGPAGVCVVDAADPPAASVLYTLDFRSAARCVAMTGLAAHVGLESGQDGRVVGIDVPSGTVLYDTPVAGRVDDVGAERDALFVLAGSTLQAFSLAGASPAPLDTVAVSACGADGLVGRKRLFVGGGLAYVTCAAGFDVVDVSDPANISVAGRVCQRFGRRFKHVVPAGSGPLVVADLGDNNRQELWIYDPATPADTCTFITQINTPGDALAIGIHNGLAYVADGAAGVQVVNYLAFDIGDTPPFVELALGFEAAGVEEGKRVWMQALVEDDVQVRNVEFYLNGERVAVDGGFPFEHRFTTPRIADGATFTVRAVAFDTGGNSSATEDIVVTLSPDQTPPRVLRTFPEPFGGRVRGAGARFSEPLDATSIGADAIVLWEAGPDGAHGTADDRRVEGGELSWRAEIDALFLSFPEALPRGRYRAVLSGSLEDLAGLALGQDREWRFRVYNLAPPSFDPAGGAAIGLGKTFVTAGAATATVGCFVRHSEPLDAFAFVVDRGALALAGSERGDDLAPLSPEFFHVEDLGGGRTVIAASLELATPFVFPTIPGSEPEEVARLTFALPAGAARYPLRVLRDAVGDPRVYPELTVRGRAVTPAEIVDGEIVVAQE
jgi:hypothetical protein